jgi:hypothetical protein
MTREEIERASRDKFGVTIPYMINFAIEQVNKALGEAAQIAIKDCYYDVEAAINKLKIKE